MPHTKESDRAVLIFGIIEMVLIFWVGAIISFAMINQEYKIPTYIVGAIGVLVIAFLSIWLHKTGRLQRKHSK